MQRESYHDYILRHHRKDSVMIDLRHSLQNLREKHRLLDERIEILESEKIPETYIKPLKVEKLKYKDEIARLEHELSLQRQ